MPAVSPHGPGLSRHRRRWSAPSQGRRAAPGRAGRCHGPCAGSGCRWPGAGIYGRRSPRCGVLRGCLGSRRSTDSGGSVRADARPPRVASLGTTIRASRGRTRCSISAKALRSAGGNCGSSDIGWCTMPMARGLLAGSASGRRKRGGRSRRSRHGGGRLIAMRLPQRGGGGLRRRIRHGVLARDRARTSPHGRGPEVLRRAACRTRSRRSWPESCRARKT